MASQRSLHRNLQESLRNLRSVIGQTNEYREIASNVMNEAVQSTARELENRENILSTDVERHRVLKRQKQILKNIADASRDAAKSRRLILREERAINQMRREYERIQQRGNQRLSRAFQEEIARREVSLELQRTQQASMVSSIPIVGRLAGTLGQGAGFMGNMITAGLKIGSVIKSIVTKPLRYFVDLIKQAWSNFLEIQRRSGDLSADLGLSATQSQRLRENFAALSIEAGRFGADMSLIESTMRKISDTTNRNVLFDTEDMRIITNIAKSTGLGADNTASLIGNFELINMSIQDTGRYIESVRKNTTRMNLNVTKNLTKINTLFDDIKGLSFKGGLEGLTKLVSKAESLRFNLSNISSVADPLMTPEGAIKLASNLKVLGGSYAGLADPMNLMYLAQYDQAKLMDQMLESTTRMATVSSKGIVQISPAQRMVLKEFAQLTGQSADELYNAALQGGKLRHLISQGGLRLFSREDQQALLNMSEFRDGKFYLTMDDGTKRTVESMKGDSKAFKNILDNRKMLENAALGRLDIVKRFDLIKSQLALSFDPFFRNLDTLLSDSGLIDALNNTVSTFAGFTQRYFMKYFSKGSPIYNFLLGMGDKMEGAFLSFENAINLAESQGKSVLSVMKDGILELSKNLIIESAPYFKAGYAIMLKEISSVLPSLLGGRKFSRKATSIAKDSEVSDILANLNYKKINDGIYDKGMLVSGPKGSYKLDKADQFIAGTKLFNNGIYDKNALVSKTKGSPKPKKTDQFIPAAKMSKGAKPSSGTLNLNISGELHVKSNGTDVKIGKEQLGQIGMQALAEMVSSQIEKNNSGTYKESRNGRLLVKPIGT